MKRLDSFADAAQWGRLHLRDRGYGGEGGRARPSPEELLLYWPFPSLLLSSMAFIRIAMMICAAKGVVVDGVGEGFYCRNKPRRSRGGKGNTRVSRNSRFIVRRANCNPFFLDARTKHCPQG